MNSCELVTFVSSLACAISCCCDKDEIALIGTILTQLGDTVLTIAAHEDFCKQKEANALLPESSCTCNTREASAPCEEKCAQSEPEVLDCCPPRRPCPSRVTRPGRF